MGPREIRIFSRDEKKQDELRRAHPSSRVRWYIGDVRDSRAIEDAAAGVDYIFHAAALKQVPSCEFYPMEAVRTNVLGTDNVLRAAELCRVARVVVLSTDKAAYPINAMGVSKAMMEKVMVARSRVAKECGTILCGTRYGNVMASRGSVIPLFLEQIAAGTPLTVTEPSMTRFMMTLDSAVDLVLYAFEHAQPGDIFVQKAPAATIGVLASALQRLLKVDSSVRVIGTRHGEKQYETLLTREEMARAQDLGGYFRVGADNRDLNYNLYFSEGSSKPTEVEGYHSHNTQRLNIEGMMRLLLQLDEIQHAMRARGLEPEMPRES